jgi:hypothetical protein
VCWLVGSGGLKGHAFCRHLQLLKQEGDVAMQEAAGVAQVRSSPAGFEVDLGWE